MAAFVLGFGGASRRNKQLFKRPAFSVTSIKLNKNCTANPTKNVFTPATLHMPCAPVRALIRAAYSAYSGTDLSARRLRVVGGPDWIDSDRYDIDAKTETKAHRLRDAGSMLRSFLEDSLRVKVHKEARETSVYTLTAAEANPALRHAKDGDCVPTDLFQESRATVRAVGPVRSVGSKKIAGKCEGRRNVNGPGMAWDAYGITMAELAGRILSPYAQRP